MAPGLKGEWTESVLGIFHLMTNWPNVQLTFFGYVSGDPLLLLLKSLQSCPTLCDPTDGSPSGSPSLDSPGKNTGVGCHFLLQEIL